ncbi:putative alpha-ketoglutarate-dependent sulfonate dioxygenase [Schizosaccharomyces pombe]
MATLTETVSKADKHDEKLTDFQYSKKIFNGVHEVEDDKQRTDFTTVRFGDVEKKFAVPKDYKYKNVLPTFPNVVYNPTGELAFEDKGLLADPKFSNLLKDVTKVEHLARDLGTVLYGIQLSKLNDAQKNELARYIAERGVVYFPDQEQTLEEFQELGQYYGHSHKHGSNSRPFEDKFAEFQVVYSDRFSPYDQHAKNNSLRYWHSDVSFEKQPSAQTFFKALTVPEQGGDTLFISGYAAYEALSTPLKKYLEGLTVVHSGKEQSEYHRRSGQHVRLDGDTNAHPIVRTHPVTGWKSLFISPGFTRYIPGIPRGESDAILDYLYQHIANLSQSTVRIKWTSNGVAAWDNRIVIHRATYDHLPQTRHLVRIAAQGEVPFFDANSHERSEDLLE